MKAMAHFMLGATLALGLMLSTRARADHGFSSGFHTPAHRPIAVCGASGCYAVPRRSMHRFKQFSRQLGYGAYYGFGFGPGQQTYGPYWPGDYRNGYAGLFGCYQFPPAY